MTDVAEVNQWISQLSQCKQLTESDVKKLCDKVSYTSWTPLCLQKLLSNLCDGVWSLHGGDGNLRTLALITRVDTRNPHGGE
jgi:hypothetical protein